VYDEPPEFRSTALILGSAVHGGIGWFFEQRLENRSATIEAACDVAAADVAADLSVGGVRFGISSPESLEHDARHLVNLYLSTQADAPVVQVERKLEVDLVDPETGEVLGRPLKGYLDLVHEDGTVIEIKTASRGWSEGDLGRNLQLGAYSFALESVSGNSVRLQVHVLVKLKREPRLDVLPVSFSEQELGWWKKAAADIEASIAAGSFPPAPSPLCHQCEYVRACSSHRMYASSPLAESRPSAELIASLPF